AVDAVGIAFVFPDIAHQARAEITAEDRIQYHHRREVGMLSAVEMSADADRALYAIGVIDQVFLHFIRSSYAGDNRFRRRRRRSRTAKYLIKTLHFFFSDMPGHKYLHPRQVVMCLVKALHILPSNCFYFFFFR